MCPFVVPNLPQQSSRIHEIRVLEKDVDHRPAARFAYDLSQRIGSATPSVLLPKPIDTAASFGDLPFRWLQSAEIPTLAFVVTDPTLFFKEYRVGIRAEEMQAVGLDDLAKGVVLVILTVPQDLKQITANLQGPVVLNPATHKGKQIVLADPNYSTRHRLFPEEQEQEKES